MATAKFKITRTCEVCGTPFFVKTLESRYCSRRCTDIAYKRRSKEKIEHERLKEIAQKVPDIQNWISVHEAVAIFEISAKTIYRLIRDKKIDSINIGIRQTKVNRSELAGMLPLRESIPHSSVVLPKFYNLDPENCFTIGEIHQKYNVSASTIYKLIRSHSIPMRQIGKFVYVPKDEIINLLKNK